MGLGGTAKKIQKLADRAEQLYSRLNDVYDQVQKLRESLETTEQRVERLETENAKQQALVEALAREQGIDVDEVLADVEGDATDAADAGAESGSSTDSTAPPTDSSE